MGGRAAFEFRKVRAALLIKLVRMAPSESDTAAAVQDTKDGDTLSRAGRALRALRTDTVEGHGQMAHESSDPNKQELRGRSMRANLPSWRSRMEAEECDA